MTCKRVAVIVHDATALATEKMRDLGLPPLRRSGRRLQNTPQDPPIPPVTAWSKAA
jgi:hypothetical protein